MHFASIKHQVQVWTNAVAMGGIGPDCSSIMTAIDEFDELSYGASTEFMRGPLHGVQPASLPDCRRRADLIPGRSLQKFGLNSILLLLCLLVLTLTGMASLAQTRGPENGSLVIVGGGMQDLNILREFAILAGGKDAPVVVIPTAGGAEQYDEFWPGLAQFRAAGLSNLRLAHTYDRNQANTMEFAQAIREAQGVWFSGGRQWRLADSYLHTEVHTALLELLDRGGVIGGSSAGATILGSYLARGDTTDNSIMMGDHEEGFGFIENIAIDQHLLRRNRHFDLLEIIEARPELLGIGLDEDTAIVLRNQRFRVIGQRYVVIYDKGHQIDSGGDFYFWSQAMSMICGRVRHSGPIVSCDLWNE